MLEALISMRPAGERGLKRRGDVLCIKLPGSPWGALERRFHQVVRWQDAELEARLLDMVSLANPYPAIGLPYAEYQQATVMTDPQTRKPVTAPVLAVRSRRYLDLAALPAQLRARMLDPGAEVTAEEIEPHRLTAEKQRRS